MQFNPFFFVNQAWRFGSVWSFAGICIQVDQSDVLDTIQGTVRHDRSSIYNSFSFLVLHPAALKHDGRLSQMSIISDSGPGPRLLDQAGLFTYFGYLSAGFWHHSYILLLLFLCISLICCWVVWGCGMR